MLDFHHLGHSRRAGGGDEIGEVVGAGASRLRFGSWWWDPDGILRGGVDYDIGTDEVQKDLYLGRRPGRVDTHERVAGADGGHDGDHGVLAGWGNNGHAGLFRSGRQADVVSEGA